ncbi:hypothetical protein NDN08_001917 [Rhodosorus marinus]|uniref:RNA helicase n=1 Tax=Rhodosorus marinus TaxID=101924 RepID=A0AAV8US68_9RHOD|nr:hypothetical protein NDN08_001917 [Rhodosorus marinus]
MENFLKLGLRESTARAFASFGFHHPTGIQALAIPKLLKNVDRNFVVAASTGSGKTLTYMAASIERMRDREEASEAAGRVTLPGRPHTLVLVPTRELGEQVLGVAKAFSLDAKFRAASLLGNVPVSRMNTAMEQPFDILVATPGTLVDWLECRYPKVFLSYVKDVVLDEADALLAGKGFPIVMKPILDKLNRRDRDGSERKRRFIYVGATAPTKMLEKLSKDHRKDLEIVKSRDLHKIHSSGVFAEFVLIKQHESRFTELRKALEQGRRMIIFCKQASTVQFLAHVIADMGFGCSMLYGSQPRPNRAKNWREYSEAFVNTIVCTDIASRGLDDITTETVFMYDPPKTGVDYLHRTGRLRAKGKVIVLVNKYELNATRAMFISHVRNETMEDLDRYEYVRLLNHVRTAPRKRGIFRNAIEPAQEDLQHRITSSDRKRRVEG